MGYNLLDERWIPVLYRDGKWGRVGIRKAVLSMLAGSLFRLPRGR